MKFKTFILELSLKEKQNNFGAVRRCQLVTYISQESRMRVGNTFSAYRKMALFAILTYEYQSVRNSFHLIDIVLIYTVQDLK